MQRLSTLLTGLIVALALVMAGPGAARVAVTGTLTVICAHGNVATVWLDDSGTPVDPAEACRTCPDCLAAGPVLLDPPLQPVAFVARVVPAVATLHPVAVFVPTPQLFPAPRGPPAATAKHRIALL